MWINTDCSSTLGKKVPLLKKISGQWQCRRWCRKLRDRLTVWVDFGTVFVIFLNLASFKFQEGQNIGAHVLILSVVSPVFASMFQDSTDRKVEIVDFEMAIFTQLLTYFYTGVAQDVKGNHHSNPFGSSQQVRRGNAQDRVHRCFVDSDDPRKQRPNFDLVSKACRIETI
jgi:hypothetical protein